MPFERVCRVTPYLSGGYTIAGVARLYGVITVAGAAAINVKVRQNDINGKIVGVGYAAANTATEVTVPKPTATEVVPVTGLLYIDMTGDGGICHLKVNHFEGEVTKPSKNLVCRFTKA
jgi:hypothetical protein